MKFVRLILPALIFFTGINALFSQTLSLEFMGGSSYQFPVPLTIHQDGQPDLRFSAQYDTNPFGGHAPYYAWRVGLWNGQEAWEFEHLHTKVYLNNPPPEILSFAISHGYNYILLGHAWKRGGLIFHLGVGPIITHPETVIRGIVQDEEHGGLLNEGYYFSGMGFHAALGKNFNLNKNLFVILEGAFTAGFAWWVPVAGGWADVPNMALHGHLGMGYNF